MITAEEQIDLFDSIYRNDFIEFINTIIETLKLTAKPILNYPKNSMHNDFIELIISNINLKKMYYIHYKHKNLNKLIK